ncbi:hypothetical protein TPHA_0G01570 [Tetrapisispora phaffii CBS 4417]|uniref:Uncharacterized protein n=1 Tax=Tetrapisispora phaffii (strain ATCC 24235 / CBS 4417 / NBRC 1672 / NRRL Y-8282 / UCD 70-5) TaxID=1071381 RepID=G8BVR5_TETPH|nr:hypothetical protein TPHA_0G01570 [Tetrapisispora phaffii CBS 4417]CCE63993.1 hypothetical protein TPHA_0G01570 [Tetrapisispora phaffii CBS 4417]
MFRTHPTSKLLQKVSTRKTGVSIRSQSSYSFYNVQVALQNGNKFNNQPKKFKNLKNSINRSDRSICHTEKFQSHLIHNKYPTLPLLHPTSTTTAEAKQIKFDYSSLPKAPTTHHLHSSEFNTDLFYSGYRPLSIDVNQLASEQENPCTCYEISLSMDIVKKNLKVSTPWLFSATGSELYKEWDNIPKSVLDNLKCFHPPQIKQTVDFSENITDIHEMNIKVQDQHVRNSGTRNRRAGHRRRRRSFNFVAKKIRNH